MMKLPMRGCGAALVACGARLRERRVEFVAVLSCAVIVALIWIGVTGHLDVERERALERNEVEHDRLVRLFEEHARRTLAVAEIVLQELEADYRAQRGGVDLARYLHDRKEALAPYFIVGVVDAAGDLVWSSVPLTGASNFATGENFAFHRDHPGQDMYIAKPRTGTLTGRQTIYLSRRINQRDGSFGGYIGVGLEAGYFSGFYDQIDLGKDALIGLFGRDGVVRARQSVAEGADTTIAPSLPFEQIAVAGRHLRVISPNDGIARRYNARQVSPYPLYVVIGTSEASILARFEQERTVMLGAAGILTALIIAIFALLLIWIVRERRMMLVLRASEDRYSRVEQATSVGIWDWNLTTGVRYLSARGKEIFGLVPGEPEVDIDTLFARIHPDDRARVAATLQQGRQDGAPYRIEYRVLLEGGGYRWVLSRGRLVRDARGRPERMVGAFSDITQSKDAERQLREQARLLDLIFRHSIDCVVLLDRDFNFIRVSESYARAGGRSVDDFPGRNHFELYPSDFEQEIAPYRASRTVYRRSARPFIFPDHPEWGPTYWDLGLVPILDEAGQVEFFLFTLMDMSARVLAEEEAKVAGARSRALSRRIVALQEEERRTLSRELHDEVGQHLSLVKIQLQAVELGLDERQGAHRRERLREALGGIATVLDHVRNLSTSLRPMQLDDLGLTATLSAMFLRAAAAAGWELAFEEHLGARRFEPGLELACYRVAQEALTNILRHAAPTRVCVTLACPERDLLLAVQDNGCGFDLTQVRSDGEFLHLGLLGMEERVASLGGTFEVRTAPGQGATVSARFPIDGDPVAAEVLP